MKNGKGIQIWQDGKIYEGQWYDNQIQGVGRMIFENGDTYEGNFKQNM